MSTDKTLTSSGFYVSQEAPIHSENPIPTPQASPPDILRCAYMELVVTDLAASRVFYVDVLGLYVTDEDADAIYAYLRSLPPVEQPNRGPTRCASPTTCRLRSRCGGR